MNTIKLNCENCGKSFDKLVKEYNRCEKRKMKHCCSRSCTSIYGNKQRPPEFWKNNPSNQNIKKYSNNRQDEYSPFKFCIAKGRASIKKHKVNIDLKYLKNLWEKQNGICPYTGIKMILPRNTLEHQKTKSLIKASLDRIDSSKEYIEGNVEFVCMAINNAKNNYTKEEMKSFIKEIISSHQNTLSVTQVQPT